MDNPSDAEVEAAAAKIHDCTPFFNKRPWAELEPVERAVYTHAARRVLLAAAQVRAQTHVSVPRDDAIAVVASLAATISIIERTPQARKAAMSDKAFGVMLDDYTKALAKGRAMLSASGGNRD